MSKRSAALTPDPGACHVLVVVPGWRDVALGSTGIYPKLGIVAQAGTTKGGKLLYEIRARSSEDPILEKPSKIFRHLPR